MFMAPLPLLIVPASAVEKGSALCGPIPVLEVAHDEVRFFVVLVNNVSAVRELADETLRKIAHELTENLRQNITVDWSQRESVRASSRLMVKRIFRKYKCPPDLANAAVELVLQQAEALGESWA